MKCARRLVTRLLLAGPIALLPIAALPQGAGNSAVATITVRLSNFSIDPDQIRLRAGTPVHLRLVNASSGGHNFSAPAFFAASKFPAGSPPPGGVVEVPAGASAEITALPVAPGTYKVECTHFLHALFGMTGRIIVDPAPG
jgi:plastocyanin